MSDANPQRSRHARLVVGCGYLGGRVARRWLDAGDRVLAVTRRPARAAEFAAAGIEPVVADVAAADARWDRLPPLDTVLWAVGFDREGGGTHRDVHVAGLGRLLDGLAAAARASAIPPPRIILSSSTGVWGDEGGGVVDESTPPRPARETGHVLLEAETLLASHACMDGGAAISAGVPRLPPGASIPPGPGVALRFAGLYGPGRLPRLDDLRAGLPIAANPDSWLNLVHIDDAARVVCAVAAAAAPRSLYVVSDGKPVLRRDWYGRLAALAGAPAPAWDPAAPRRRGENRRVDPSLLFRDLDFAPEYPDAIAALASLVRD